jgi:hypothetical protein
LKAILECRELKGNELGPHRLGTKMIHKLQGLDLEPNELEIRKTRTNRKLGVVESRS